MHIDQVTTNTKMNAAVLSGHTSEVSSPSVLPLVLPKPEYLQEKNRFCF